VPITPQEKTRKVSYTLPESLVAWIEDHAKSLNDSSPEYVVAAVLQQYREHERKAAKPRDTKRQKLQKAVA
jgi:Arc/MetJ-type ribon-helix-helix transcriptional regulator